VKKKIMTIFLFLCVTAISVGAYLLGKGFDRSENETFTYAKQLDCETNIELIDSIQYCLENSKHPEPLIYSKFDIEKNPLLSSVIADSKLNVNEKVNRLHSIQDSLRIQANLFTEKGRKLSGSISKRGTAFFVVAWLLFIIPVSIIRMNKKTKST
jgi:hypothetical protein